MPGKSGYGANIPWKVGPGRFRVGKRYPEREGTYYGKGNYCGYPNKEAFLAAQEAKKGQKKMDEKQAKRRETIRKEARDIQDMAREFTERALMALVRVMENENASDSAIIAASEALINRAYGKAAITTINTNLNADVKPSEINASDLDKRIADALSRVERITGREAEASEGEKRPSNLREYN